MELSEKEFEKQAAELLIWAGFVVMRVNTIKKGFLKSYKFYVKPNPSQGCSDLIAFYPPNKCLFIETKKRGEKLRESQIEFQTFMEYRKFTNVKKASTLEEIQTIFKELLKEAV
jgi:hypothetical protein